MLEYVLKRVILTRNGPKEDNSFTERCFDTLEEALMNQEYHEKVDEQLHYYKYGYYIESRIRLDYHVSPSLKRYFIHT